MTMPKLTGTQLSSKLKEIRPGIKIIICTGYSEQISEEKAKQLGIDGYIMKPVIRNELSNIIRKVLDG